MNNEYVNYIYEQKHSFKVTVAIESPYLTNSHITSFLNQQKHNEKTKQKKTIQFTCE